MAYSPLLFVQFFCVFSVLFDAQLWGNQFFWFRVSSGDSSALLDAFSKSSYWSNLILAPTSVLVFCHIWLTETHVRFALQSLYWPLETENPNFSWTCFLHRLFLLLLGYATWFHPDLPLVSEWTMTFAQWHSLSGAFTIIIAALQKFLDYYWPMCT